MLKLENVSFFESNDSDYDEFDESVVGTLTIDEDKGTASFDFGENRIIDYILDGYTLEDTTVTLRFGDSFVTFMKPNPEPFDEDGNER